MRLVDPTDFRILGSMTHGKRMNPKRVGEILQMDNSYMSDRLRHLEGHGFVEEIGDSTMYEITDKGRVAYALRGFYTHAENQRWADFVERETEHGELLQD